MTDTLEIRCLVEALTNYIEADRIEKRERDNYTGYSWGYHGYSFIREREEAAEKFGKLLNQYIDERVTERLTRDKASAS